MNWYKKAQLVTRFIKLAGAQEKIAKLGIENPYDQAFIYTDQEIAFTLVKRHPHQSFTVNAFNGIVASIGEERANNVQKFLNQYFYQYLEKLLHQGKSMQIILNVAEGDVSGKLREKFINKYRDVILARIKNEIYSAIQETPRRKRIYVPKELIDEIEPFMEKMQEILKQKEDIPNYMNSIDLYVNLKTV